MVLPSISDLIKLLDQVPIWKRLVAIPRELEELRRRVSALEADLTKRPKAEACPICGEGELKVAGVRRDPVFGDVGLQRRTLKCGHCGHTEDRQHDPSKK